MLALPFPIIDPILLQLGPIAIRWYGMAYVLGVLLGWRWLRHVYVNNPIFLRSTNPETPTLPQPAGLNIIDNFLTAAILGIVLGGRLVYVLFYKPYLFLTDPLKVLQIWEGGMSFHGGLIGILLATAWFCRTQKIDLFRFGDLIACAAPIGLFFGRLANFINSELYGRLTDVSWAVIFPTGGPYPRHPSQLYEAALEGVLLFILCNLARRFSWFQNCSGRLSGLFLIGYALARIFVETFREPDAHIGFLWQDLTMGQALSLPLLILGLLLLIYRKTDALQKTAH